MKHYLILFFLLAVNSLVAQNVKGRAIDSILKLDSLFIHEFDFPFKYEWIKRENNNLIFKHSVAIFDSTRQVQNRFKIVMDTISLDCLKDTSLLTPVFSKYDLKNDLDISYFLHFLNLLLQNDIIAIEPAGTGDCAWCSRYLFINNSTAFVILDKNSHCYPTACYWRPRKTRQRKIRKDIYLVSNIRNYH